ncbi:MAG TPA: YggS family pyridoxal phosphate-dependent enzyme [Planctomycetaceae bacterium]|nr:YggS family pyridoxal phosphate-dependent enzyme [Planctomycetaceae bacterium]
MVNHLQEQVARRLAEVRGRIDVAAVRAGRLPESVRLVAVTKYAIPADGMIEALLAAGCRDLGESRPQALLEKSRLFDRSHPDEVCWHLIGSLQKNKIRKILPRIALIHSIDSLSLAEAIDRIAEEERIETVHGLLEVNISGDVTKHGFMPDAIGKVIEPLRNLRHLKIDGLMGMGGLYSDPDQVRAEFAAIRRLAALIPESDTVAMRELSMGMSDDFEIAVEEGATLLRLGSVLYV